jgi:hypothetical protein
MNNKKRREKKEIFFLMSNLISKVFVFISNGIEFYPSKSSNINIRIFFQQHENPYIAR